MPGRVKYLSVYTDTRKQLRLIVIDNKILICHEERLKTAIPPCDDLMKGTQDRDDPVKGSYSLLIHLSLSERRKRVSVHNTPCTRLSFQSGGKANVVVVIVCYKKISDTILFHAGFGQVP